MLNGVVIKSTGSWYKVLVNEADTYNCRIAGKFKLADKRFTNPIAVGDKVTIEIEQGEEGTAVIRSIEHRENYVVRQSPRKKHHLHIIASNVDQAMLIVTMREPNLKIGFVDRFMMMTEPYSIPTIIVFNKTDICTKAELVKLDALEKIYNQIGYKVLRTSAVSGEGLEEFKALLSDSVTLLSGQSGVGKSTLVNAIEPTLDLRTYEISDFSGKGQHTTTFAQMFKLSFGGYLIDTPGIKSLSFTHLSIKDIADNFREFFIVSSGCKYSDCVHRNEPKCAVKDAVEKGTISPIRYQSYLSLIDEVESQNYWEMNEDL